MKMLVITPLSSQILLCFIEKLTSHTFANHLLSLKFDRFESCDKELISVQLKVLNLISINTIYCMLQSKRRPTKDVFNTKSDSWLITGKYINRSRINYRVSFIRQFSIKKKLVCVCLYLSSIVSTYSKDGFLSCFQ